MYVLNCLNRQNSKHVTRIAVREMNIPVLYKKTEMTENSYFLGTNF